MIIISFKMFMTFLIRLGIFCVKVFLSVLFVMSLQIQVGSQSLEKHLEAFCQNSLMAETLRQWTGTNNPQNLVRFSSPVPSPFSYKNLVQRSINHILEGLEKNYPINGTWDSEPNIRDETPGQPLKESAPPPD